MAAKARKDPLAFRLDNLADRRMQRLLKAAAEKFGWMPIQSPSGRGFGLACSDYAGTYVATMAEAEVDKATGRVRVKRIVCAHDCGVAVNPEGMRLQIEGCMTMGLGYALTEEIHFQGRRIKDLNYDTYELPRFSGCRRSRPCWSIRPSCPSPAAASPPSPRSAPSWPTPCSTPAGPGFTSCP